MSIGLPSWFVPQKLTVALFFPDGLRLGVLLTSPKSSMPKKPQRRQGGDPANGESLPWEDPGSHQDCATNMRHQYLACLPICLVVITCYDPVMTKSRQSINQPSQILPVGTINNAKNHQLGIRFVIPLLTKDLFDAVCTFGTEAQDTFFYLRYLGHTL